MKLYNVAYSGNSYKVRLLLAQIGIACEIVEVDILKGESRTPEFLKINPNGRTPVLDDSGFVLAESNAILAYLARGTKFLPEDRQRWGSVFQWLFFEQYSHEPYIATSRFWLQHKPDSPERDTVLAHLSQLRSTEDFFVGQGLGKVSDFKGSEFESVCSVDQVSFQALQFAYNQTPRCTFDRTGELKMAKNIATGTS